MMLFTCQLVNSSPHWLLLDSFHAYSKALLQFILGITKLRERFTGSQSCQNSSLNCHHYWYNIQSLQMKLYSDCVLFYISMVIFLPSSVLNAQVFHLVALNQVMQIISPCERKEWNDSSLRDWVRMLHSCKTAVQSLLGAQVPNGEEAATLITTARYCTQADIVYNCVIPCSQQERLAEDTGCPFVHRALDLKATSNIPKTLCLSKEDL